MECTAIQFVIFFFCFNWMDRMGSRTRTVLTAATESCSNSTNSSCGSQPSSASLYYLPPLPTCCSNCTSLNQTALNLTDTPLTLEEKVQDIRRTLTLDKSSLSGVVRRKTSAEDPRVSATAAGSAGLLVLVTIIGFIVVMDVGTACGVSFCKTSNAEISRMMKKKRKKDKKNKRKKQKKRMQQEQEGLVEEKPKLAWG